MDDLPTGWPATELARHEPRWVDEDTAAASSRSPSQDDATEAASAHAAAAAAMSAEPAGGPAPDSLDMPEFMRRAQRQARWNRPVVKVALGLVSVLLAVLLSLQVMLHFRDALSALHPPLRSTLTALCGVTGCEIKPWKRIDALSIDSTSLNPMGSGGYKLSLALRNKTAVDVAAPSVELSLTDANGAPLARRVIGPEAMSPALTQVGAESEQTLSLVFTTGGQRVSGYSVNIFYP
jgi:hypothetical protein